MKRFLKWFVPLTILVLFLLPGCGSPAQRDPKTVSGDLEYEDSLSLRYAEQFTADHYKGGYTLLTVAGQNRYLLIPRGKEAPSDLPEDVQTISMPLQRVYLVNSGAMDYILSLDAAKQLRFTAMKQDGWYLSGAKELMERGELLYAGKYSAPDYEMLKAGQCDLAIENTMIFHTPEVKEQLERLGIPVIVDYSSYENTPQGKVEWIKFYGELTGKRKQAEELFSQQEALFEKMDGEKATDKTVVYFYITSGGEVRVRRASDSIPKMIELAGGQYAFPDLGAGETTASSTVTLQMEAFYAVAKDADFLIYNSTIDGELKTLSAMLEKEPLLRNCRAVQNGNVFCTTKNLYQASMSLGTFTEDLRKMLTGERDSLQFLYPLE